jgi:DNA-binding transcriptional LysR family regulator
MPLNLDLDVLRTLATAIDLGGFARAGEKLGRSQSAISQQMKKLEEQVGQQLLKKQGRGLALTASGELILGYARRLLELNDEALTALNGLSIAGQVRFGLPQDFAEAWLPSALARFRRAHPAMQIEARVDRNVNLVERLKKGELDIALMFDCSDLSGGETVTVGRLPMSWIGPKDYRRDEGKPVQLALFEPPCRFRSTGLAALDRAGIPWEIGFTSPSLAGLWAAVDAGLGITVRTPFGLPKHFAVLGEAQGLPKLRDIDLGLHLASRSPSPAVARLRDILVETLTPLLG